jgi:hypothetical protein
MTNSTIKQLLAILAPLSIIEDNNDLKVLENLLENNSSKSLDWYKSLDINTKINAKDLFTTICGISFSSLSNIFSFKEKINILHNKLITEGII